MVDYEQGLQWLSALQQSIDNNTFIKISLGNYKGVEPDLKNIYVKLVLIKELPKLSFTYRYKTRDVVKNYDIKVAELLIQDAMKTGFHVATLFTQTANLQFEKLKGGKVILREMKASHSTPELATHDRLKKRHIQQNGQGYLHDLGITNVDGIVLKHAQDKFKQINHYIELLSTMLKELPKHEVINVLDMGSGKGYLTFALYDFLLENLKLNALVTGVEYRKDLVDLCNKVSAKNNMQQLQFTQGSIQDADCTNVHIVIALHACDTATDDAIYKGIQANADLIVVAPCCHKQIRKEMEQYHHNNALDFIVRHGTYLERTAEMLTDSLRALMLEYAGYKTKVFEFIAAEHTPKNVMIVAQRIPNSKGFQQKEILDKIHAAKTFFGIKRHYLETLIGLDA